jgi:FKBP-type peptidyl-prolyl cis-trans isomerase SlyD
MTTDAVQTIQQGKVVTLHYRLTDDAGQVLDSSEEAEPITYLHGAQNIVPGLEKELEGRGAGDRVEAVIPPAEAYGEPQGPGPQPVPRSALPDDVEVEAGMQFMAEGPGGDMLPLWVTKIDGDQVFLDSNHPLAGETLHFDVQIVEVRDATSEEVAHGHPHGPGGAHE